MRGVSDGMHWNLGDIYHIKDAAFQVIFMGVAT